MSNKSNLNWPKFNIVDADIVILGSYPGKRSLDTKEFYANPTNQFWDLLGINKTLRYEEKLGILKKNGIGLWDVLEYCNRHDGKKDTSLDKNIKDEVYNDLSELNGKKIFFNGQKAYKSYEKAVSKGKYKPFDKEKVTILLSSSRACTNKDKKQQWNKILKEVS